MTPDDLGRTKMIKHDSLLRLNSLGHKTKEKCENFTENTPYQ